MLRLLTERLRIYLHPDRIVLIREAGLFRKRVILKDVVLIKKDTQAPTWQSVILTLGQTLEKAEWKGLRTYILLSGSFLKFRVADWHEQLSIDEQTMLLKHRFEDIYGDEAKNWDVFISNTSFKKNELACAIDATFIKALRALFTRYPLRLEIVQPWVTGAINIFRKKITNNAWLILIEHELVYFIRVSENGWKTIHTKVLPRAAGVELDLLFEREVLHAGESTVNTPIYFFWPENPSYKPTLGYGYTVTVLTPETILGLSIKTDVAYAPALCV